MTQTSLKSIMRLFALVSQFNLKSESIADEVVRNLLDEFTHSSEIDSYYEIFDYHNKIYQKRGSISSKRLSLFSVKSTIITEELVDDLRKEERTLLLLSIIDILYHNQGLQSESLDLIRTLGVMLHFYGQEVYDLISLIDHESEYSGENILAITRHNNELYGRRHYDEQEVSGVLHVLLNRSTGNLYFRYVGDSDLFIRNGKIANPHRVYRLQKGGIIENYKIKPIFYGDLLIHFSQTKQQTPIQLAVKEITYHFPDGVLGIHPLSVTINSGEMVGVMGNSGTGKTTLLNILAGKLNATSGDVLLNGQPWESLGESSHGLVGYIPQDDMLIKELTVYQNLYFTARLCYQNQTPRESARLSVSMLEELGLDEVKNLQVGTPEKSIISGGQRKRLNIGLELIRQPQMLFIDEPTSGLSSTDSERIVEIIKVQTQRGKLALVNIHQPSSNVFKLFDKLLLLDQGGRAVYYGNPIDAIVHFRTVTSQISPNERECQSCGNVNPEQVLDIIESKRIRPDGMPSEYRMYSPQTWYDAFRRMHEPAPSEADDDMGLNTNPDEYIKINKLPEPHFDRASSLRQFSIFIRRSLLAMIADRQFLAIMLLQAPLLALLLAYLSKYFGGDQGEYTFFHNQNIPAYMLMAVIVAMFTGLMVSAERIIRDRHIIERERFLGLSRLSYINSKAICLLGMLGIQILLFVVVGNLILGIRFMGLYMWIMLFSIAFNAGMLGLNLSSGLRTSVAIYITIPILLMPQLLLNGSLIPFDKLHRNISSYTNVPLVANMAVSRWGFEALLVHQFTANPFQRHYMQLDMQESQLRYAHSYLLPELQQVIEEYERLKSNSLGTYSETGSLIINSIEELGNPSQIRATAELFLKKTSNKDSLLYQLNHLKRIIANDLNGIAAQRAILNASQAQHLGSIEQLIEAKGKYTNRAIENLLLARNEPVKIVRTSKGFIRKFEPVYAIPDSQLGRSHFLSAYKRIGSLYIDTYWFNLLIIWLITGFLYLSLYFDWLKNAMGLWTWKRKG